MKENFTFNLASLNILKKVTLKKCLWGTEKSPYSFSKLILFDLFKCLRVQCCEKPAETLESFQNSVEILSHNCVFESSDWAVVPDSTER